MYLYILPAIAGALMLMVFLINVQLQVNDYALAVDAFVDNDGSTLIYRVVISNVGRYDITDINIDYGTYKEFIPMIRVGEKTILSPKDDANKEYVTISANPNIHIVKEYRSLPKMVKVH